MPPLLRPIAEQDIPLLVQLNNTYAAELSLLDAQGFAALVAQAFYAKCTPDRAAFLIAFAHSAAYDSPNFLWFKDTGQRFVYVDRIAVAASARGAGLARLFYQDLFASAAAAGFGRICCEVNLRPPNPASDRFHQAQGFVEVGRAELAGRDKTVRYLKKELAPLG
ncbi:MAG: GNAT family N-acetyltransferase [Alphaproteobacteria bacterium]